MPKHWGIQFDQRMEQFTKKYVSQRLYLWSKESDVRRAKRDLKGAEQELAQASIEMAHIEEAVGVLMEIGPQGLMEMEWETKLSCYTPEQFLNAYKNGVKY